MIFFLAQGYDKPADEINQRGRIFFEHLQGEMGR